MYVVYQQVGVVASRFPPRTGTIPATPGTITGSLFVAFQCFKKHNKKPRETKNTTTHK